MTSSPPPQVERIHQHRLTPLVDVSRRFAGGPAHPEILTRLIEESVSVQVHDFANSDPVCRAQVEGGKNLWVHGLELEKG